MQQQQQQPRPKPPPPPPVSGPAITTAMPSDMFMAQRVGSSVFCTIEGRLVCLHIKTDHTFLITVTQEPLVLHVGTFRFEALTGGRSDASVAAFAKAFIEAFDSTALLSANAAAAAAATTIPTIPTTMQYTRDAPPDEMVGVELILAGQLGSASNSPLIASPLYQASTADGGAAFARRSSLVNLHREKLDVEMRDLGGKGNATAGQQHGAAGGGGDGVGSPQRSEAELLSEANANLVISARVRFSVFGTLHSVVLDLKPCPAQPNIREHLVWGIFMDLYRTVVRQRRDVDRLERGVDRLRVAQCLAARPASSGGRLAQPSTTTTGASSTGVANTIKPAKYSPRKSHHDQKPMVTTVDFLHRTRDMGHGRDGPPKAETVVDLSALFQSIPSSPRTVANSVNGRSVTCGSAKGSAKGGSGTPVPVAAATTTSPVSSGRADTDMVAAHRDHTYSESPSTMPKCPSSRRRQPPPCAPAPWAYTQHSVYMESSIEATPNRVEKPRVLRPTSASADFQLRCQYVRDVQAKSSDAGAAVAPHADQGMLLHPQAPPSATHIRGTYSGRLPRPVATVTLTL